MNYSFKIRKIFVSIYLYPILTFNKYFNSLAAHYFRRFFLNIPSQSIKVNLSDIGLFNINSNSDIFKRILFDNEYEKSVVNAINMNTPSGMDAINVGANVGIFTILLSKNIKPEYKVLSIEPTPNAFNLLRKNILENDLVHKVIVQQVALSDCLSEDLTKLYTIPGNEEYSSLQCITHSSVEGEKSISIDVPVSTIDALVEINNLKPGIIVIDVEGAEFKVLSGAINTIKSFKPIIIAEIDDELLANFGIDSKTIISFLKENNYIITDIENRPISYPFAGNIIAKVVL